MLMSPNLVGVLSRDTDALPLFQRLTVASGVDFSLLFCSEIKISGNQSLQLEKH